MAIQVRRGLEADFDADKMLPGEWAVSTDTQYVRMCFSPGIVLRMATYESFEADVSMMQDILADCKDIQTAIKRIQTEINQQAKITVEYSKSAHEYAQSAAKSAQEAKMYAGNASAVTNVQIATKTRAGIIKGGDNGIAEDGTLELIKDIDGGLLNNSYDGKMIVNSIHGVSDQYGVPTVDTPSPFNNVVPKDEYLLIDIDGKNLANIPNGTYEESYTVNCNLKAGKYILSFDEFTSTKSNRILSMLFDGGIYGMAEIQFNLLSGPKEFDVNIGFDVIAITIFAGTNDIDSVGHSFTITNAMICREGTDNAYVPYKQGYSFELPISEPFRYCDKIVKQNGVWVMITSTNAVPFGGTWRLRPEVSTEDGSKCYSSADFITDNAFKADMYMACTHLSFGGTTTGIADVETLGKRNSFFKFYNESGSASGTGTTMYAFVDAKTLEGFMAEMEGAVFEYEIDSPVVTPLSNELQEILNNLETYYGATYILSNSDVLPRFIGMYASSKIGRQVIDLMDKYDKLSNLTNELATQIVAEREV